MAKLAYPNIHFVTGSFFEKVKKSIVDETTNSEKKSNSKKIENKKKLRLRKVSSNPSIIKRTIPQKVSPTDNDNDGVPNNVDIDDDNDGVLDVNESSLCGALGQTGWTRTSGCQVSDGCGFGQVVATYTGGNVVNFTSNSNGGTAGASDSGGYQIEVNNNINNVHRFTFSQPVTDPKIYFNSIGNGSVTSRLTFSGLNISKISGSGGVSGNQVFGTENDCYIKITGTFTSITFTTSGGYSTGFETMGVRLDLTGDCTPIDTDGDGIPNSFDLDSDGDGCSDAIESRSSTTAISTTVFPTGTDTNGNGLLNVYEGTTAGTVNYTSTYSQFALDAGVNGCNDSDGDGATDIFDIDDDNDGVLDVAENNCQAISNGTFSGNATGWVISSQNPTAAYLSTLNKFPFNSGGVTPAAANIFQKIPTSPGVTYTVSYSIGATGNAAANLTVGVKAEAVDDATGSVLMTPKTTTRSGLLTEVTESYSFTATGSFTRIKFTDATAATTAFVDIDPTVDNVSIFSCDTDNDGKPNSIDLDSDGDGCSDAIEAGSSTTATSTTTNPTGTDSNANGLLNVYEGTTAGTINYNSTYSSFAVENTINGCLDSDGDGSNNVFDIDDDNDGVLDTEECLSASTVISEKFESTTVNPYTSSAVYQPGVSANGQLFNGGANGTLKSLFHGTGTGTYNSGDIFWGNNSPVTILPNKTYEISYYMFDNGAGNPPQVETWVNGAKISNAVTIPLTWTKYTYFWNSGSNTTLNLTLRTLTPTGLGNDFHLDEILVREKCVDVDTDNDGKPNSLDLDSDGDGCSDAIEAGSSTTATGTTTFPTGTDTNGNGLLNIYEGATAGTINYTSNYVAYGVNSSINACTDTDGDGKTDVNDIDDDNDGVLDTVECINIVNSFVESFETASINPYNSAAIYQPGVSLNGQLSNDGANGTNNSLFNNTGTGTYTSGEVFWGTKNPVTVVPGKSYDISFYMYENGGGNPPQVETWVNGLKISNAITVSTSWVKYSYLWNSGSSTTLDLTLRNLTATGSGNDFRLDEIKIAENCFNSDTDNDGIPNRLDLDSDGDGCSDAIEAGSSTTATSTTVFPTGTDSNGNGLLNTYESSIAGIIKYTSYYSSNALSSTVNGCTDFDGDGVSDFRDLDTDNDGILDTVEASCIFNLSVDTLAEQGSTASFTTCAGSIDGPGVNFYGTTITPANGTKYLGFHETESFTVNLGTTPMVAGVPFTVNLSTTVASINVWASNNPTYVNIYATNNCNQSQFIGSTTIRENQAQGWVFNTFNFTPSQNFSKLLFVAESPLSTGFELGKTGYILVDNITFGNVCDLTKDNDNDGIPNIKDLDSDADGCSDALEGGATTNTTANFAFSGPFGANGLDNSKENPVDSGIVNYTSTYASFALTNTIKSCLDFDGDGVFDVDDIDDDNDGVLDIVESPNCFFQAADATVIETVTSGLTSPDDDQTDKDIQLLHDGNSTVFTVNFDAGQNLTNANIITVSYPTPVLVSTLTLVNNTTFGTSVTAKLQGSANGINWTDISAAVSLSTAANKVFTNTSTTEFKYYRVFGVSGTTTVLTTTIAEVTATYNTTNYQLAAHLKPSCTDDFDSDGFPNHLDLNSDGDSCSDAFEAGATTDATPNFAFSAPFGTNGLPNAVETTADSGVINYSSTYLTNALFATIASCTDSDGDDVADIYDLDDDNDGIIDEEEDNCSGVIVASTDGGAKQQSVVPTGWVTTVSSPDIADVDSHPYGAWNVGCTGTVPTPPNGHTDWIAGSAPTGEAFKTTLSNLVVGKAYFLKVYYGKFGFSNVQPGQVTVKLGTTIIDQYTPVAGCGWDSRQLPFTATATSQDLSFAAATTGTSMINISVSSTAVTTFCDKDNDGIPNSLDLDSDGDGCSDAIEGGNNILTSSLFNSTMNGGNSGTGYTGTSTSQVVQNLGNTVGTTPTTAGIPTL